MNQTIIESINLINPKTSNDVNDFSIKPFEIYHSKLSSSNSSETTKFGIQITFERNSKGITGILINYHLMCATLVLVASINFLIDPNVVPGRAGLLITLYLVLTSFFSSAQVNHRRKNNYIYLVVSTYLIIHFLHENFLLENL